MRSPRPQRPSLVDCACARVSHIEGSARTTTHRALKNKLRATFRPRGPDTPPQLKGVSNLMSTLSGCVRLVCPVRAALTGHTTGCPVRGPHQGQQRHTPPHRGEVLMAPPGLRGLGGWPSAPRGGAARRESAPGAGGGGVYGGTRDEAPVPLYGFPKSPPPQHHRATRRFCQTPPQTPTVSSSTASTGAPIAASSSATVGSRCAPSGSFRGAAPVTNSSVASRGIAARA